MDEFQKKRTSGQGHRPLPLEALQAKLSASPNASGRLLKALGQTEKSLAVVGYAPPINAAYGVHMLFELSNQYWAGRSKDRIAGRHQQTKQLVVDEINTRAKDKKLLLNSSEVLAAASLIQPTWARKSEPLAVKHSRTDHISPDYIRIIAVAFRIEKALAFRGLQREPGYVSEDQLVEGWLKEPSTIEPITSANKLNIAVLLLRKW